jgi:hypothetical protein
MVEKVMILLMVRMEMTLLAEEGEMTCFMAENGAMIHWQAALEMMFFMVSVKMILTYLILETGRILFRNSTTPGKMKDMIPLNLELEFLQAI